MQGTGVLSKKVAQQTMRAVCYGLESKMSSGGSGV